MRMSWNKSIRKLKPIGIDVNYFHVSFSWLCVAIFKFTRTQLNDRRTNYDSTVFSVINNVLALANKSKYQIENRVKTKYTAFY